MSICCASSTCHRALRGSRWDKRSTSPDQRAKNNRSEGLLLEPESIPVSEFTSCGAPPRARICSCSGQAPLWYTPEKITVPKAWFTGSTCLALASSLEYTLEVFLFYFLASFQSLVGFQLRETSLNPEIITTTRN
ncbi:hypothetical protein EVAR_55117_1 [Eumeta japonica]|uniref:Uncharacterized protein n=1 Tax=Eumeta variegata TaxID=151549 RepID=A0A4C1YCG5_EUMVA|nr:hypothetical protein EVAR_55117_1 [Eumeta japonica]